MGWGKVWGCPWIQNLGPLMLRMRALPLFFVKLADSYTPWLIGARQSFQRWPFLPQFQQLNSFPDLDLPRLNLDLLEFLSNDLHTSGLSVLRQNLMLHWFLPTDFLTQNQSRTSSNFSFLLPEELLIAVIIAFQLSGKDDIRTRPCTSSSNSISTELCCVVIMLSSLTLSATPPFTIGIIASSSALCLKRMASCTCRRDPL